MKMILVVDDEEKIRIIIKKYAEFEGYEITEASTQDEAGLTTTFQTWPRGWFHIPKHPDFPVPS